MSTSTEPAVKRDIEFARVGDTSLTLDLYRPADAPGPLPTILWVHGGGFEVGDKGDYSERMIALARHGYAVASCNYRLLPDNPWPAAIHDVKAALRWLRANAAEHGLDSDRLAIGGASAGGYLASLAALTPDRPDLEGEVGDHVGVSSSVRAAVAMFAGLDFIALSAPSELEREILPPSPGAALLGLGHVSDDEQAVRAISPRHLVSADAPPHLLLHGDRDAVMHVDQSRTMHEALSGAGAKSVLLVLSGYGHEEPIFAQPTVVGAIAGFLEDNLT